MSKPSAIAASLVNMRNVGSHKSVALTIHVPEEQAHAVIEAFGWPTMANPVPIAIARLTEGCQEPQSASVERPDLTGMTPGPLDLPFIPGTAYVHFAPDASEEEIEAAKEWARRINEMEAQKKTAESAKPKPAPAVQQAGIVCKEPAFWAFLGSFIYHEGPIDEAHAAEFVRRWCCVKSRAEITPGSEAEHRWNELFLAYGEWRYRHAR